MQSQKLLDILLPLMHSDDILTVRDLGVLLFLRRGEQDFSVIARELGLVKPAVTRITAKLCALGYASRKRPERDTRRVIMSLTDHGREFVKGLVA
jgi:DNA-binding MarR family transcriptional regulator